MNPAKFSQMMKYLTRVKKQKPDLPDVFPASKAPIPPKTRNVEEIEAINAFIRRERQQKAGGGMLVQPSADGSRPGYAKQKSLTKREQNIFNNYLKTRKEVGLGVPSDDLKMKIKSKVRVGTIDNQTIKNLKEIYRYENENRSLRYDTKLKRWEKTAGRDKQNYIQKKGETKSEFLRRVANIASRSQEIASKKQSKATAKTRSYIDNWTKNWLDNNLEKYGVRNFDNMIADLKKDWQKNIKNLKIDTGFKKNLSTSSGLPSVTVPGGSERAGGSAFKYGSTTFYTPKERSDKVSQWRRLFYENKINTIPGFKDKLLDYFNFISQDKRGLYNSPGGQTIKAYKDIVDRDVIYILSPDAQLVGSSKNLLFNSIDDNFSKSYNAYITKVNRSEQWKKSAALIEKTLGLKPNYIKNSMKKEKKALAKLFNVKELPTELRYTLEHGQGISAAAVTGNKEIMQRAVDDLIGTTIKQNVALGFGGFEANRNALIRDITAGVNVKDNLKSLNQLTADAYKDFGIKDKVYSLQDGQLTSKNISPATTREERFAQYFKEIYKTKEGSAAIKKQYGTLEKLLAKIGCPGFKAADGGRATFNVGTNCQIKGANLINSGMKNASPAQIKNFAEFANRTKRLGRNIVKFGILPEAMYVAADSTFRLAMGDSAIESLLRASEYLLPGDQTKLAEVMEAKRLSSPETAAIIGRSIDYKNQLAKIQSLEDQKANLELLSGRGDFDYIGDLSQNVKNVDAQLKKATDDLNNKFKITDPERLYAERMKDEVDDIRGTRSFLTKVKKFARDIDDREYGDVEDLETPQDTQKDLNQRMLPQAPTIYKVEGNKLLQKNLSEATTSEIMDHVQLLKPLGFNISTKNLLAERDSLRGMPLSQQEQIFGKEATYGFSGTMGEPLNKGPVEKKQNVIRNMENEIVGRTNVNTQGQVINPFDIDISDIGSGLRGFAAAGGGIAKEAGDRSGPPPERGPMSQGLQGLMKRVRNL